MEVAPLHPSHQTIPIRVESASAVGHARRVAVALGEKVGLGETECGHLALVVTEAGTNLLQHAGGGHLLVRALARDVAGVEVTCIDQGPGMADVAICLQDGYSSGGSRGAGLGSIQRLAHRFDIYSRVGGGTVLVACCHAPGAIDTTARTELGAVCVPYPGEDVVGDGWAVENHGDTTALLVVDGLGHGQDASDAAAAAIARFEQERTDDPAAMLEAIHRALHRTRGAAGAVATVDWSKRSLRFAGVGNIFGAISGDSSRGLSSHNGILGQGDPRFHTFEYAWPRDGVLVMHSDGLSARWRIESYPGLALRDPSVIAGVLYRDFSRKDDATVVALRERTPTEHGDRGPP